MAYLSPSGKDDTSALQGALSAGGLVILAAGRFRISSTLVMPSGCRLAGHGKAVTILDYTPSGNGVCLQVGDGKGKDATIGSVESLTITSSDTKTAKTAIASVGTSELLLRDVLVYPWTGDGSKGLRICGHNAGRVQNCHVEADLPVSIEANPNSPYRNGTTKEDLDHWSFHDFYIVAGSQWPCVSIGSGLVIQNLLFYGDQAWVGGRAGLEWIDTASQQVGCSLALRNVRWEETYLPTGFFLNVQHNHGLQGLVVDNARISAGAGMYLRKCHYSHLSGIVYGGTGTALDADVCDTLALESSFFQAGSKVNIGPGVRRMHGYYTLGSWEVEIG